MRANYHEGRPISIGSAPTVANAVAGVLRRRHIAGAAAALAGGLALHPAAGLAQGITFTTPPNQQIVHPATSVTVTVSDSDSNFGGDVSQTWTASNPAHGTLTFPGGSCPSSSSISGGAQQASCAITYTLTNSSYIGSDSFTVTSSDTASATGSVTVTITVYPSPPTASNFTIPESNGQPVAWDLVRNGDITYDPAVAPSNVVVTITTPPQHGAASVSGTTITYTPTGNFGGNDTIGYQVSDGSTTNASAVMTVAVQAPTVTIPADLVGKTQAAASSELSSDGVGVSIVQQSSNTVGAGIVIGTQPAPGTTVTRGSTVALVVSQGPGPAAIPSDVVGKTQAAGTSELTADGFVVTASQQISTSYSAGQIITTQPAPGTSLPHGSAVLVVVSKGPGPAGTTPISSTPGLTPAQQSTARSVEQVCQALAASIAVTTASLTPQQRDLLEKCTAIIADHAGGTDVPGLQETLNAISGRQATAAARIPMQFAAGQLANIGERLAAVRGGARGFSFTGFDFAGPPGAQSMFTPVASWLQGLLNGAALGGGAGDDPGGLLDNRLGVFVNGTLRRGTQSSSDAESGFDLRNSGLTLGVDYRLGTAYVLGIAGGYGKSESDFDDDGGRLDARHASVSLYGSFFTEHFHLDWLAGYGHNTYDISRNIDYSSSSTSTDCDGSRCSADASGSTGAREYTFSLSSGGDFHAQAFSFGPTVALDYKQVAVDGFTESGPTGLDLSFGGMTTDSLVSELGGYASYAWKTRWAVILPQVRVRYLHEFMNDARTQSVEFAADTLPGASGRAFQVYTDQPDRNYFDWRASLLFQFPYGIAGYVNYGGIAGLRSISMHELNVGLRLELGSR